MSTDFQIWPPGVSAVMTDVALFDRRTAYARGYRACTDGSENPYFAGSWLAKCWEAGFMHALEDFG